MSTDRLLSSKISCHDVAPNSQNKHEGNERRIDILILSLEEVNYAQLRTLLSVANEEETVEIENVKYNT